MGSHVLTLERLPGDIQKQLRALDPAKRRRFMRKVIGPTMVTQVVVRFLRGGYNKAKDWKSTATGPKKYGGRWSEKYSKRPSGQYVGPGSIRMVDEGSLANSYRTLMADSDSATVGPGARGVGEVIAQVQEEAGNPITGFTQETIGALNTEMQWYLDRMAEGLDPPDLPKSRIAGARSGMPMTRTS